MQISMFDSVIEFPKTYEDIQKLWNEYIFEGEKDLDAFTHNEVQNGRSYSFYGVKAFELSVVEEGKAKLKLPDEIMAKLFPDRRNLKEGQFYTVSSLSVDKMQELVEYLKERKQITFRNTITDTFACCNSFIQCSDFRQCIHQDDRNYNGCHYRKNLEAGRIFYGKNRNID